MPTTDGIGMAPRERKSYFLYCEGRAADVICLGNLILGDYSNPTLGEHYTHPQLSPEELGKHAASTDFKDRVIHAKHGPSYGIQLDGAQFVDFGVSWDATHETILTAKEGTRLELKDPEDFLNTQVLRHGGKAEEKLKLWLSAASSEFVLKMKWMRKPTIWMCTGLYLLERTKVFTISRHKINTSIGLDSTSIAALSGVPIGGSLTISPEASLEVGSVSEQRLVWAAQYRKLQAKYVKLDGGEETTLPRTLPLYPDVTSNGTLRDHSDELKAVQIEVGEEGKDEHEETEEDSLEKERYYEHLAMAIEEFEEYL